MKGCQKQTKTVLTEGIFKLINTLILLSMEFIKHGGRITDNEVLLLLQNIGLKYINRILN